MVPGLRLAALAEFLEARRSPLIACYDMPRRKHGLGQDAMTLELTITPDGRTALASGETTHAAVGECVRAMARGWTFPFRPRIWTAERDRLMWEALEG